jgi:hypothetical protein
VLLLLLLVLLLLLLLCCLRPCHRSSLMQRVPQALAHPLLLLLLAVPSQPLVTML